MDLMFSSPLRLAHALRSAVGAFVSGNRRTVSVFAVAAMYCCVLVVPAGAQQQAEDPDDEKQIGLWLDQGISADFSANRSLELEFHERFDEGASNLFDYFVQAGVAFRLRPWVTVLPSYRYERFTINPTTSYENRLLLNITLSRPRGPWQPNLRTLIEGRFPENRVASARFRFRPGINYTLPLRMTRRPVVVVSNEFFIVPGTNSFPIGGTFTQNRFQAGVRLPISDFFSIRPYYMLQSVNLPTGWESNSILGISIALKVRDKSKVK